MFKGRHFDRLVRLGNCTGNNWNRLLTELWSLPRMRKVGKCRMLSRLETPDSSSFSRPSPGDAGLSSALGIRRVGDVDSNHHLPAASPVHGLLAACSRSGLKRSHKYHPELELSAQRAALGYECLDDLELPWIEGRISPA